jgi:hypothetical protein
VPLGSEVVLMDSGGMLLATVSASPTDWVCAGVPESVTENVSDEPLTATVGVPEMTPVAADRVKPAGKAPLAIRHVYGAVPPDAANVAAYVEPTVPLGSDAVEIDSGGALLPEAATVIDSTTDWVCAGVPESVTEKVMDEPLTAAVGVPEMTPVAAARVKPVGRAPLVIRQVYGAVPPEAANVAAYVAPTVPFGNEVVLIDTGGMLAAIVSVNTTDWVWAGVPESATEKVIDELLTAAVGVPEMTPVAAAKVRPAGNAPLVIRQVYGALPPDAAKVAA